MNKSIRLAVMTAAGIFIAPHGVRARGTRVEEQPLPEVFQTEPVYPREKGEVQLTVSPTFSKSTGSRTFQSPPTMEYGLADRWPAETEWDSATLHREVDEKAARGSGDRGILKLTYEFRRVAWTRRRNTTRGWVAA